MSLFQICYGPEITSIMKTIQKHPGISKADLIQKFQYDNQGDISSLVEATLNFLLNLNFIKTSNKKEFVPIFNEEIKEISFLKRLKEITDKADDADDPNVIFSTLYLKLFIISNELYLKDLYYEANLLFEKMAISQEKINAWKRIMEYFGLGYRVYGGFYALPKLKIIEDIIEEIGEWEGPLQVFFEEKINPIIPCVYNRNVFKGMIYVFLNLHEQEIIKLSKMQDLPHTSFGEKNEWNWVKIGG
ncbi:hypothetical protein [Cytobacillus firmus]|uniref:hypothetical protein n=1 Tax=Cytobacillus firmus TaxID=1399 RepID=UPI0021623A57|nr:hypothetical protein [Cytobacillus firmus]MCS0671609.1 hypothetical protein [Cytobacillus firmus]